MRSKTACFRSLSVTGLLVNRVAAVCLWCSCLVCRASFSAGLRVFSFRVLHPWLLPSGVECAVGFFGNLVPVCPFGAKLCVLGHCLLCKIVTPSCFCCSQLRAGLRPFGFLISVRVLFHHAAAWCVGVPVDRLSLLIFVCIRFFSPFLQGFCVRRVVVRSVSALVRCSSCAIAVLPPIAFAFLDTLQTVFAVVHSAYCLCSSTFYFLIVPRYELP